MKRRNVPSVVASVEQQTAEAAALARIAGQARLMDPRTNPATRPHADRLLVEQHRKALDAEHARLLRRHRVADRRAADAEKTLEVIRAARQMSSPARSVLALHKGRLRFLGISLAASLTLSVGSATGVAALAERYGSSPLVGYIAEVGLTGLTTMAILYRSHLGEHGGAGQLRAGREMTWQAKVLWLLTVLPLTASIVANALSHGAVGVFCSIGAAAFSLFSYVISDQSGAALRSRAAEVTDVDEAELETIAMGGDLFTAVQAEREPTEAEREAEALDAEFAVETDDRRDGEDGHDAEPELFSNEALAAWLNEPPEAGGLTSPQPSPDTGGTDGAAKPVPTPETDGSGEGSHIDSEQAGRGTTPGVSHREGSGGSGRVASAAEARRAAGVETFRRVAEYIAAHPDDSISQICRALRLSRATVTRHRRQLRRMRGEA